MEEAKLPCALDREVFERVWRRVMPEDRPDSPIVLLGQTPGPPASPGEEPLPWQAPVIPGAMAPAIPASLPVPMPAPPQPRPSGGEAPCLGEASARYGGLLQQYIDRKLSCWRIYRALSRRVPGDGGKTLSTMAADEHRHAKRLSTAYFLISGVRYWPPEHPGHPLVAALPALLRQCFVDEQQARQAYREAAQECCDNALRELYLDVAEDDDAHARLLRRVLEQM